MCSWCSDPQGETYCQDCGATVCQDAPQGSEYPSAYYVTSYGDLYCWRCGQVEQRAIDEEEEEEATLYGDD